MGAIGAVAVCCGVPLAIGAVALLLGKKKGKPTAQRQGGLWDACCQAPMSLAKSTKRLFSGKSEKAGKAPEGTLR